MNKILILLSILLFISLVIFFFPKFCYEDCGFCLTPPHIIEAGEAPVRKDCKCFGFKKMRISTYYCYGIKLSDYCYRYDENYNIQNVSCDNYVE